MKKRNILFLILFTLIISLQAQEISVRSFRLLPNDLTANIEGGKRYDPNTRKNAALIKVVTPETGFYFDGGSMGLVGDPKQEIGEVWVYVPEGSKKITIKHASLGLLRDYFYPEGALRSGKTYEMVLSTGKVITHIEHDLGGNYATLIITPKNAEVHIDGNIVALDAEGVASTWLSYGKHSYEVSANMYKKEMGSITINGDATTEKTITLEPEFSIVNISSNPSGATLYIDEIEVGTTPVTNKRIASGEHMFQFNKQMYLPKTVKYNISSGGETKTITETLQSAFSEITITAPNQSEIYVNNEKKGVGNWTGNLNAGEYVVEARKESHHGTKTALKVEAGVSQAITLEAPTPRYGTLNIQTNPARAKVIVGGEELGLTPGVYKNILIGEQEITLKKEGYATRIEKVSIQENEVSQLRATLQSAKPIKFTTNKPDTQLYIDGEYVGPATGEYDLAYGTHNIVCKAQGAKDFVTTINVKQGQESQTVSCKFNTYEYVDKTVRTNQKYQGVVYLKNGSVIRGEITEQAPNQRVKIQTSDGNVFVYERSQVLKINKEEVKTFNDKESSKGVSSRKAFLPTPCYKGFIDMGYTVGVGDYGIGRFSMTTTHGIQIVPYLYLGAGFGFNYFIEASCIGVPVFADLMLNFSKRKITPFIDFKAGYSFCDVEGLYLSPSFGCNFGFGRKAGFSISLGYEFQVAMFAEAHYVKSYYFDIYWNTYYDYSYYNYYDYEANCGGFVIKVGLNF